MDLGANKTLTGGLALQTLETYRAFIGTSSISFGGNDLEIYFEEDDLDRFADELEGCDSSLFTRDEQADQQGGWTSPSRSKKKRI